MGADWDMLLPHRARTIWDPRGIYEPYAPSVVTATIMSPTLSGTRYLPFLGAAASSGSHPHGLGRRFGAAAVWRCGNRRPRKEEESQCGKIDVANHPC